MHEAHLLKNLTSQLKWLLLFCSISILSACGSGSSSPDPRTIDTEPPVITLDGEAQLEVVVARGPYAESGATAIDNVDGQIDVVITGEVDTNTLGDYIISYSATDAAGNTATVTRTVTIREALPFITTWKAAEGSFTDNQITITTATNDQNYTIDWGDGTQDTGVTGSITHTYASSGIYTVTISGDFRNIKVAHGDTRKILSIEQWGDIQWSTMKDAFRGCSSLELNATDAPDLSAVTNMSGMFYEASAFNGDLSQWDVSSVTDMRWMFSGASAFNGDISQWDVSSVTDMSEMFYEAIVFNQDLTQWDVSAVTNMSGMFYEASAFNGDISQWNVSAVTDMSYMFNDAIAFNGDISDWDVSSVTDMSSMFNFAKAFNGDISDWDVSSVTDMNSMFSTLYSDMAFNGDISRWDVSAVTDMSYMFSSYYANSVFNSDISKWDVSAVTDMSSMFVSYSGNSAFNRDISDWDVSAVTDMSYMFLGVTLSTQNYDALLQGWSSRILQADVVFDGGNSQYSSTAQSARDALVNTYGWTIRDGGLEPAAP